MPKIVADLDQQSRKESSRTQFPKLSYDKKRDEEKDTLKTNFEGTMSVEGKNFQ